MSALPDVTESTFTSLVLGSDKPVLVDFWAPWCGPCRMLSPIVEKVSKDMGDRVVFLKMNTDENPSTAGKYGISGIPALLLYKGGEVVDRIVGFVPEQHVRQFLDKHLAAA
ncbi:MAG: thioredoxin [Candidatus Eremiobacteraeota bacterium]|nr:thioredoxin [Candidatus Eremiobacteraeota bacterium]MBV8368472.1 thioredoxin [Candidatus Eremiobacteraeota bacterium]